MIIHHSAYKLSRDFKNLPPQDFAYLKEAFATIILRNVLDAFGGHKTGFRRSTSSSASAYSQACYISLDDRTEVILTFKTLDFMSVEIGLSVEYVDTTYAVEPLITKAITFFSEVLFQFQYGETGRIFSNSPSDMNLLFDGASNDEAPHTTTSMESFDE